MEWFDEDDEDDRKPKATNMMSMMMDTKPLQMPLDGTDPATGDDETDQQNESKKEKDTLPQNPEGQGKQEEDEDALDAYMKSLGDKQTNLPTSSSKVGGETSSGERLDMENEDEATAHWELSKQAASTDASIGKNGESAAQSEAAIDAKYALDNTFHKASHQEHDPRNVDIQLKKVQHDQMNYVDFNKCFLPLDQTNKYRNSYESHKWRKENHVHCNPPLDPIYDFAELRDILPPQVLEWNATKNITKPTLVQSQTLGIALAGLDVIATSSTGSGKTLTYLWPMAAHLMANQAGPTKSRSLVLVPTKELALQVEQVAKSMFAKMPITVLAITGGNLGRYQLSQKLQSTKPHCVIATPGRLLDVLSSQQKSKQDWLLPNITLLVLDEADKMIQFGFANQVTQILQNLRPDRQSLLVSATFDSRLQRRCQEWMNHPTRISIGKTGQSSKHVTQHVLCLPDPQAKIAFLKETLPTFVNVGRTLVFCATKHGVEDLAAELRTVLPVETLHGDRHPMDRKAALKAFTNGDIKVLVATDVAGRGLDIPQVSTVVNFDPPKNWETHLHRIGRSGRLSAKDQKQHEGSAYTLLLPSNGDFAKALIRAYEREDRPVPEEVRQLAERSKQHQGSNNHNSNARNAYNQSGLGYSSNEGGGGGTGRAWQGPPKRGRWS
ncbi:DEAD/DEAH box helicase domain protein [Nitzschia inconspicua]|uniref:RNA helicase n=1 Tax=Nitzschia inconspicua TaxID=303405 RepID=A0A9K3PMI4_9STRA|nr:DEAD/DEAH box helicase domain protein [Nitzschia inconspicua]